MEIDTDSSPEDVALAAQRAINRLQLLRYDIEYVRDQFAAMCIWAERRDPRLADDLHRISSSACWLIRDLDRWPSLKTRHAEALPQPVVDAAR